MDSLNFIIRFFLLIILNMVSISLSGICQDYLMYNRFIKDADSLYKVAHYKEAANSYSLAFKAIGWKAKPTDRYNAACSWNLSGNADSAFYHLSYLIKTTTYTDEQQIQNDPDLRTLHGDKRWGLLVNEIKKNKNAATAKMDQPTANILSEVYQSDQQSRKRLDEIQAKYGIDSKESKQLLDSMQIIDSHNLAIVSKILDEKGWLGPAEVGIKGNIAIFLVIQHSNLDVQQKYLEVMRNAVENHKASASNLALLEDRISLAKTGKQIYGSQIGTDSKKGLSYIFPIANEQDVNIRRAKIGMEPLEEYAKKFGISYKPPINH